MNGPQLFLTVTCLIAALLVAEKLFVKPPLYSEELLSWGQQKSLGVPGAEGPPPQRAGIPAQSTLTHGQQVDVATVRETSSPLMQAQAISDKEFQDFLAQVKSRLPTRQQAKALTAKQVHGAPEILKEAAVDLADLAERLQRNPGLRPQALGLYQECALNPEVFRSVRALCFQRAQLLSIDLFQDAWDFDPAKIPNDVIELAKQL